MAGFIGSPAMNLVEAELDGRGRLRRAPGAARRGRRPAVAGRVSSASVRRASRTPPSRAATCRRSTSPSRCSKSSARMRTSSSAWTRHPPGGARGRGARKTLRSWSKRARCSPHESSAHGGARRAHLAIAVDPLRFHFFDPATGVSLLGPKAGARPTPCPSQGEEVECLVLTSPVRGLGLVAHDEAERDPRPRARSHRDDGRRGRRFRRSAS